MKRQLSALLAPISLSLSLLYLCGCATTAVKYAHAPKKERVYAEATASRAVRYQNLFLSLSLFSLSLTARLLFSKNCRTKHSFRPQFLLDRKKRNVLLSPCVILSRLLRGRNERASNAGGLSRTLKSRILKFQYDPTSVNTRHCTFKKEKPYYNGRKYKYCSRALSSVNTNNS